MKILIIRFSSIGDIVLTSAAIRCIKNAHPNASIHYCTKKSFEKLVSSNPHIDKVYSLDKSIWELIQKLRTEKYDVIIDLHHNLRTKLIKTILFAKSYSFNKENYQKWKYVKTKKNIAIKHVAVRYIETASKINVVNDNKGLEYYYQKDFKHQKLPFEKYKVLVLGAQHKTKKMPLEKLLELLKYIEGNIIIIGGKTEQEEGQLLVDKSQRPNTINLCGTTTIDESAFLIQYAEKVITHDTGMLHIAAAFKKEIYVLWGNTTPLLGFYPYKTNFTNFEVSIPCRPCSKIGFKACPEGHHKCMNDQKFTVIS